MTDKIKRLAEQRQKKGWSREEIEAFAKRRSEELKKIAAENDEPDYLASGTQKSIEEICSDDDEEEESPLSDYEKQTTPMKGEVTPENARQKGYEYAARVKSSMTKKGVKSR